MTTATAEPGYAWTRSREHARVVPQWVSDLFGEVIRRLVDDGLRPTEGACVELSTWYGLTPVGLRSAIVKAAEAIREMDRQLVVS